MVVVIVRVVVVVRVAVVVIVAVIAMGRMMKIAKMTIRRVSRAQFLKPLRKQRCANRDNRQSGYCAQQRSDLFRRDDI